MARQLTICTRPLWLAAIIVISLTKVGSEKASGSSTTTASPTTTSTPTTPTTATTTTTPTTPTTTTTPTTLTTPTTTSSSSSPPGKALTDSEDSTTRKTDPNSIDRPTSQPPSELPSIETQTDPKAIKQPNGVPSSELTNQQPTPSTGKGSTASGDSTTVKTDPNSIDRTTSQPSPKLNSIETQTDSKVTEQPNGISSSEFSHKNANSTESTSILPPATTENLTDSLLRSIAMIVTIIAAFQL